MNDWRLKAYRMAAASTTDDGKPIAPEAAELLQKLAPEKIEPVTTNFFPNPDLKAAADALKNNGLVMVPSGKKDNAQEDSLYRRVAKFLVLIGTDEAAKILPHLAPDQQEKIIPEIASIRSIDRDEAAEIFEEFKTLLQKSREDGGVETARSILEKAFGAERAEQIIEKAVPFAHGRPFEYLADTEPERILAVLKDEADHVQSLVLSQLEPQKSAAVINLMDEEMKTAVILRLAKMSAVSPEIVKMVDKQIEEKMKRVNTAGASGIDGRNALTEILKRMDLSAEQNILESISDSDPELGEDLRNRLFSPDDVINGDDKYIQTVLHNMTDKDIVLLIAGKKKEFTDKILYNISARRRYDVRMMLSADGPFRRADCETVTSMFFAKLRRAWEDGKFFIAGRDDGLYIE